MTTRNTLILGVCLFLGLVVSGRFTDQAILGQQPAVEVNDEARYEMTTINTPHGDYVIVFDSKTGQCWSQVPAQVNDSWQDMGIPSRGSKRAQNVP